MPTVIDGNTGVNKVQNGALTTANLPSQLSVNASAAAGSIAVDASGRVTMPNQPAFAARQLSNASTDSYVTGLPADLVFSNVAFNNGGHYNSSNGRFTAPVSGMYYFAWNILVDDNASSGSVTAVRLHINGSSSGFSAYDQNPGSRYQMMSQSCVLYMNAGDFATCVGAGGFVHNGSETAFTGFLLG
jgi:hypothetical protein